MEADYADDLALLTNTPARMKGLLHSLEQTARGIGFYKILDNTVLICLKQSGVISTLNYKPLKLVNYFTYLDSNISLTESDINICIGKAFTAIIRLLTIWKSNLSARINEISSSL